MEYVCVLACLNRYPYPTANLAPIRAKNCSLLYDITYLYTALYPYPCPYLPLAVLLYPDTKLHLPLSLSVTPIDIPAQPHTATALLLLQSLA